MMAAAWPLQTAIVASLSADAELQALLGDPVRLFDDVPPDAAFPYAVFGPWAVRDAAADAAPASEHVLTLTIWSRAAGTREVKAIAAAIEAVLQGASLPLDGHRLANLRVIAGDTARMDDAETYRGTLRLRAVVEPL